MGYYVNPPEQLAQRGRQLNADSASYEDIVSQLRPGERLFGLYDRGMFKNAVLLYSSDEFGEFEEQVKRRIIKRLGFYALSDDLSRAFLGRDVPEQIRATA